MGLNVTISPMRVAADIPLTCGICGADATVLLLEAVVQGQGTEMTVWCDDHFEELQRTEDDELEDQAEEGASDGGEEGSGEEEA